MIKLLTISPMRFLAYARNDMAIRWLWGSRSGDSRKQLYFKSEIPLRIATSAPPLLPKDIVIPSASEGSPSPITVLSKTELQRTFFKFYILCDLINVVDSNEDLIHADEMRNLNAKNKTYTDISLP